MGTRSGTRGDQERQAQAKLPEHVTEGCWDKLKRGTANPDAGQGYMERDIFGRSDLVPT